MQNSWGDPAWLGLQTAEVQSSRNLASDFFKRTRESFFFSYICISASTEMRVLVHTRCSLHTHIAKKNLIKSLNRNKREEECINITPKAGGRGKIEPRPPQFEVNMLPPDHIASVSRMGNLGKRNYRLSKESILDETGLDKTGRIYKGLSLVTEEGCEQILKEKPLQPLQHNRNNSQSCFPFHQGANGLSSPRLFSCVCFPKWRRFVEDQITISGSVGPQHFQHDKKQDFIFYSAWQNVLLLYCPTHFL